MYIPKLKSLKDLLLWIPRFVFNLGFKAHAFLVTLLAIVPILLATCERVHTPEGVVVALEKGGYLTTGNFDSNADSIYLSKGTQVRLLAQQEATAFWAETANGSHRGFIKVATVGKGADSLSLPRREKRSCRPISEKRFGQIVERYTLEQMEQEYLNAEYVKSRKGGKKIVEFGFKVFVMDGTTGKYMRPVVTYDAEGKYLSHKLIFWQYPRSKMMVPELVDLMGPVVSVSEFPLCSPFESVVMEKAWCYLPGLLLLGLFAILLVLRIPLIWAPNSLVGVILFGLGTLPPALWLSSIKSYGLAGWFSFTYIIVMVLNLFFLWVAYSGLRCPKCKHLNQHEYSAKRNGRNYWERHTKAHEQERGPKQREWWSEWKYAMMGSEGWSRLEAYNNQSDPNKWKKISYREHTWEQSVTYRDYITHSHIQEVINTYKCPHCGHGKDDINKECLESYGEWAEGTYTKHYAFSEKVTSDNQVFDQESKER